MARARRPSAGQVGYVGRVESADAGAARGDASQNCLQAGHLPFRASNFAPTPARTNNSKTNLRNTNLPKTKLSKTNLRPIRFRSHDASGLDQAQPLSLDRPLRDFGGTDAGKRWLRASTGRLSGCEYRTGEADASRALHSGNSRRLVRRSAAADLRASRPA
jgi:hypothetical protein